MYDFVISNIFLWEELLSELVPKFQKEKNLLIKC